MKRPFPIRLLAALLVLAVLAVAMGCAQTRYDRFDSKRQARQEELLRWMQTDRD